MLDIFEDKYYQKIKENLSAIALIPTIIGGLRQIIGLLFMGVGYLRYFSITQVVPDGLLILIIIILIIAYALLMKKVVQIIKGNKVNGSEQGFNILGSLLDKFEIMGPLVISIILVFLLKDYSTITLIISFGLNYYFFIKKGYIEYKIMILNDIKNKNWIELLIFVVFIYLIISQLIIGFQKITLPLDTNNCKILNEKIIYSNDKYIFVKLPNKSIKIYKFEDQFNGKICNKQSPNP